MKLSHCSLYSKAQTAYMVLEFREKVSVLEKVINFVASNLAHF